MIAEASTIQRTSPTPWPAACDTSLSFDSDYLEFYIDGVRQDRISGDVDWQQKSYTITGVGPHYLLWQYIKDGSGSSVGWADFLPMRSRRRAAGTSGPARFASHRRHGQRVAHATGCRIDILCLGGMIRWRLWRSSIRIMRMVVKVKSVDTSEDAEQEIRNDCDRCLF